VAQGPFQSFLVAGLRSFGSAKVSGWASGFQDWGSKFQDWASRFGDWATRSEGWAQVFWDWARGFDGWATRFEGWAPQFCGYLLGFGAKAPKTSHSHCKNTVKHEENAKRYPRKGRGSFKARTKRHMCEICTCFTRVLSIWLGRASAGKGGKGDRVNPIPFRRV
jgi:hypothetical protein